MTNSTKKVSLEELKNMVREAVVLQLSKDKETSAERREKMKADKEKSMKKENVQVVTFEQLRGMVKEAVNVRLAEHMGLSDVPGEGDFVAFQGQTGWVASVKGDKVAVTRDGIKMHVLPVSAVKVLATAADLDELSPEELEMLGSELDLGKSHDPGEDPQTELDRIEGQLGGGSSMLAKPTRNSLNARKADLKKRLGLHDEGEVDEAGGPKAGEPYDRHQHGYLASMTARQMPSDDLLELALADGWHMNLKGLDAQAFQWALEKAGMDVGRAEAHMGTVDGMKRVIQALINCDDDHQSPQEEKLCRQAESLASSIMDQLGFEWI